MSTGTERTPGQAAQEASATILRDRFGDVVKSWAELDAESRGAWDVIAQAGSEAVRQLLGAQLQSASRAIQQLAQELGEARAVVAEMDAHIASGDDYADPAKRAEWFQRAGIDGQSSGRGSCEMCLGSGVIPVKGCTCGGGGPDGIPAHDSRWCGYEPCPAGCPVPA